MPNPWISPFYALASSGLFLFFGVIAFYIYWALAHMTIAKKLNYDRPWLAWIPLANIAMILQWGGFHWAWIFLILVPILGWIPLSILEIISRWRIYEDLRYPGWLSLIQLGTLIPYLGPLAFLAHLFIIGLVAWKKR